MGTIICPCINSNHPQISSHHETEQEIQIYNNYITKGDKELQRVEVQYNLLHEIDIFEFFYSLSIFDISKATLQDDYSNISTNFSHKDIYFSEPFTSDLFQVFLEQKILKHPSIYVKAGENESLTMKFKLSMLYLLKSLLSKLIQYDKEKEKPDEDQEDRVKKYHCMALGILLCKGKNISKIKLLFDLFEDEGKIKKTDLLFDFVLSMCLLSCYCMLYTRNKIGINDPDCPPLDKKLMLEILNSCELKDSKHLATIIINTLFPPEKAELTYDEFKSLFTKEKDSMGFLISTKGLRLKQEENNL